MLSAPAASCGEVGHLHAAEFHRLSRSRLTGAKIMAALSRDPRFRDLLKLQSLIPYGAHCVLRIMCQSIADSDEPGVFRPNEHFSVRVASLVAIRMRVHGAEDQIESDLAALVDVGVLLRVDGGGYTLPIDVNELSGKTHSRSQPPFRPKRNHWGDPGGRPRAGETPENARNRRYQEHMQRQELQPQTQQRPLNLMQVHPGRIETSPITSKPNLEVFVPNPEVRVSEVNSTNQSTSSAAAAALNSTNSNVKQQQQCTEVTRVREKPLTSKLQVSGIRLGGYRADSPVSEAESLARKAAGMRGWNRTHTAEAVSLMQGYLDQGYTTEQIRIALAEKPSRKTNSAKYLVWTLERLFPNVLRSPIREQASAKPSFLPAVEPAVAGDPEWAKLAPSVQRSITTVLDNMRMSRSPERQRLLSCSYTYDHDAFCLVAARHPELWEMADKEPPVARVV